MRPKSQIGNLRNNRSATRLSAAHCALLLFAVAACGQQLAVRTFTTADGLANSTVNRILSDSRGFLWFATDEGLSRYDGYGFTSYGVQNGLPQPAVGCLVETRSGVVWIGTYSGLSRIASAPKGANVFETYSLGGLTHVVINAMAEGHDGTLWVGTDHGLWKSVTRNPDGRFERVSFPLKDRESIPGITSIVEDRFQTLWIGGEGALYRRWPDGRVVRQDPDNMNSRLVRDVGQGRLLISLGPGRGLMFCTPDPDTCSDRKIVRLNPALRDSDYVVDAVPDGSGGAWVITITELFRVYSGSGENHTRRIASAAELGDSMLNSVGIDRAGNIWAGSDQGSGAAKFITGGFVTYTEGDGLGSRNVISVFEDASGELCAVSRSADGVFLNRLAGEEFQAIRLKVDSSRVSSAWHGHDQVLAQTHNGRWWLATNHGLAAFSGIRDVSQLARATPTYYPLENFIRLFPDGHGNLWISQQHRLGNFLMRWNSQSAAFEEFPSSAGGPEMNNDRAEAYTEDQAGRIWIGFERGGLWQFSSRGFMRCDAAPAMPADTIHWLHTDRSGRIWVGFRAGGAVRSDDPGAEPCRVTRYTTDQGLSSNQVLCITEDLNGHIYFCTGRGVDRLDPKTGRIRHFTTRDGLAPGELQAAYRDKRGWLWFGTQQGLSRLIPDSVPRGAAPPVTVTGVNAGGKPIPVSPYGQSEVVLPDLPPGNQQVQIEFVGLGFSAGEVLQYQYRLEGSAPWSAPTPQRAVIYSGLRPGNYSFAVRAVNSEGLSSPRTASVRFTIFAPFWMRWWFLCSAFSVAAAAVWAAWTYRLRQLAALHAIRMRITADLHDDIGSSLSQLAILSELARCNPEASRHLERIARLSRDLVDSMSDVVWATDPRRDRLGDLVQRMRQFGSEVLEASNIEFRFITAQVEQQEKVNISARRQIFLIFKESIHNIMRHSSCRRAETCVEQDRDWLMVKISDDGIGFDVFRPYDGQGLASMRARAKALHGEFVCTSGAGGTTIRLKVPLRSQTPSAERAGLMSWAASKAVWL